MKTRLAKVFNAFKNFLAKIFSPLTRIKFLQPVISFFTNKDILTRLGVTLFIIIIYRALANIPLPGVDMKVYNQFFGQSTASEINYLFTIFTGGRVDTPSIV